jgi:ATP-dependent RNA helicase DDX41
MVLFALQSERTMPLVKGEGPTGIICCPSRELARQTYEVVEKLTQFLVADGFSKLNCMLCIGGISFQETSHLLNSGLHMVVSTPGRLLDMLNKKKFTADICRFLCLDEADRMIDLGFEEDVRHIFDHFKYQKQLVLFSATMPKKIQGESAVASVCSLLQLSGMHSGCT